jgi:hypothetical protein
MVVQKDKPPKQREAGSKESSACYPEDGGDTFPRNTD